MGSYRLNLGTCKGLPEPAKLAAAMETLRPKDGEDNYELAVTRAVHAGEAVLADLLVRKTRTVRKWDAAKGEMTEHPVESDSVMTVRLHPALDLVSTYAGGARTITDVHVLLASELCLPVVTDVVKLDLLSAVRELQRRVNRFTLVQVKHTEFASDSYTSGPFAPRFIDTQHGLDFLEEQEAGIEAAVVTFAGPSKRVRVTIRQEVGFAYSCHDDDQAAVQKILMGIAFPSERRILEAVRDLCPKDGETSVTFTTGDGAQAKSVTLTKESRKRANRKLGEKDDA